jgi:hypothetical protein
MCLTGTMVGILPKNHRSYLLWRGGRKCRKDLFGTGKDWCRLSVPPNRLTEIPQPIVFQQISQELSPTDRD